MKTKPSTFNKLNHAARVEAYGSTIKETLHHLANLEAANLSEARTAYAVGLTEKAERLLGYAAHLSEARRLIEEHATPDNN
jgi:hypothetical protein